MKIKITLYSLANLLSKHRSILPLTLLLLLMAPFSTKALTKQYAVADMATLKTDLAAGNADIYELTESGGQYTYSSTSGTNITIGVKSAIIRAKSGLAAKPILKFNSSATSGYVNILTTTTPNLTITFDGIEFDGRSTGTIQPNLIYTQTTATNCQVVVNNCYLHHFASSYGAFFLRGNGASFDMEASVVDNCIEHQIFFYTPTTTAGVANYGALTLKNNIFSNYSGTTSLVYYRAASGFNATGTTATIDHCTFYKSTATTNLFLFRQLTGAITVSNCLFDQIAGSFSFNSPTPTKDYCYLAGFVTVPTGTNTFATVPGYTNAGSLDFTLTNKSSFVCADGFMAGVNKYTTPISAIANTTASSGGQLMVCGAGAITEQGVCWSLLPNPTTDNSKAIDGGTTGIFTSSITGLTAGTSYYVRSYAVNSACTTYGNELSFTTTGTSVPTLGTTTVPVVTAPLCNVSGTVISDGSSAITARGICWNTATAPTIFNNTTSESGTTGTFTSSMAGLSGVTTYYVRAYATNAVGTAYGTEQSFTTGKIEPTYQVTSLAVATVVTSSVTLSFTSAATGSQNPDGYLVKLSTGAVIDPVDGVDPANLTSITNGVANEKVTVSPAASFTGMSAATLYNYKVYSYTGSGSSINYNTTSVPSIGIATIPYVVSAFMLTASSSTTGQITWTNQFTGSTQSVLVFVKPVNSITLGTPTNAPSTYIANTALDAGTAYQGDALAHCVYNGVGTSVSITGLTAGVRYYVLCYVVVNATNSDNTSSYSGARTANQIITAKAEPTNQVTSFANGTVSSSSIPLSWTAAVTGTVAPDGYLIKLNTGTVVNPVDATDPADVTAVTANAANVKVMLAASTSAGSFTGLNPGTMYNYSIYSFTNSGAYINFKLTSIPTLSVATLPNPVSSPNFMATGSTTAYITWVAPAGYDNTNNSTLVFVKATTAVTEGTPVNAPGSYSSNTAFGAGTAYEADAGAYCVYNGDGTNVSITGLSANTTYTVLIYTMVDAANSNTTRSHSAGVSGILLPPPPTSPTVVGDDSQVTISFTAPVSTAGSAITGYTITSTPGSIIQTGASSPILVTNLTNGTAYTFTVIATNANGNSVASAATASVIPTLGVTVTTSVTSSSLGLTAANDVTIANGGTLTVDGVTTVQNLDVAGGGKVILSAALSVLGNVVFEATDAASFSANLGSSGMTVTGTVSYRKTMDDTKWYFISFPCDVTITDIAKYSGTGTFAREVDWFLRYYDGDSRTTNLGASSNWKTVVGGTLTAYKGYIFGLKNGNTPYVVSFPLTKAIVVSEAAHIVPVVAYGSALSIAESHKGWNLVGQPYLSKYNGTGSNANYMILFEGGSYYSTYANTDVTSMNPFAAYFVQAGTSLAGTGITFALDNGGGTSYRLLAPTNKTDEGSDRVKINFTTATGTDNTNLIMADTQSSAYQIGEDMEKWVTTATDMPQIYTALSGIKFAYNALPVSDVQNLPLSVYTRTAGNSTISADGSRAPGLSQLLLTDNQTGITTDLLTADYNFLAGAGTNSTRFSVAAQRIATTSKKLETALDSPSLTVLDGKLMLKNIKEETVVNVYDAMGHLIASKFAASTHLEIALPTVGVYAVQIKSGNKNWTRKVVY